MQRKDGFSIEFSKTWAKAVTTACQNKDNFTESS